MNGQINSAVEQCVFQLFSKNALTAKAAQRSAIYVAAYRANDFNFDFEVCVREHSWSRMWWVCVSASLLPRLPIISFATWLCSLEDVSTENF